MIIYNEIEFKKREINLFKLLRMLNKYNINLSPSLRDDLFSALMVDSESIYGRSLSEYLISEEQRGNLSFDNKKEINSGVKYVKLKDKNFGKNESVKFLLTVSDLPFNLECNCLMPKFYKKGVGDFLTSKFSFFRYCLNAEESIINDQSLFGEFKTNITCFLIIRLIHDYKSLSLKSKEIMEVSTALNKLLVIFLECLYEIEPIDIEEYPNLLDDNFINQIIPDKMYDFVSFSSYNILGQIVGYIGNNPECAIARYVNQHKNSLRCGNGR